VKIVVIGGAGLIGWKTVAILRQGGHEVVAASPKKRSHGAPILWLADAGSGCCL
jgi:nucleoside-diphosphate-sugar epimerase